MLIFMIPFHNWWQDKPFFGNYIFNFFAATIHPKLSRFLQMNSFVIRTNRSCSSFQRNQLLNFRTIFLCKMTTQSTNLNIHQISIICGKNLTPPVSTFSIKNAADSSQIDDLRTFFTFILRGCFLLT